MTSCTRCSYNAATIWRTLYHILFTMFVYYRVSDLESENQMNPSNLGIVFGPTLLRQSEGPVNLDSLIDTAHQTRAVELLIVHSQVNLLSLNNSMVLLYSSMVLCYGSCAVWKCFFIFICTDMLLWAYDSPSI